MRVKSTLLFAIWIQERRGNIVLKKVRQIMRISKKIAGCFLFLMCFLSGNIIASSVTVEDIISGIKLRKSKVRDLDMIYSAKKDYQDAYYESRENKMKGFSQSPDSSMHNLMIKMPPRKEANAYHIFKKDDKLAYDIFNYNNDGTREITRKAVYKDGGQKYLNIPKKNGAVKPLQRDKFFEFLMVPQFLGINNIDILSFMKRQDFKNIVLGEHINEDDDLIVDLQLRYETFVDPTNEHGYGNDSIVTICAVSINASKDFWPVKIDIQTENHNNGKPFAVYKHSEIRASEFVYTGGVYFPTKIDKIRFYQPDSTKEARPSEITAVRVEKVEINSGVSDDVFELEFPNGTFYHDEYTGLGMTVGDATPLLSERMQNEIIYEAIDQSRSELPELTEKEDANTTIETPAPKQPLNLKQDTRVSYLWVYVAVALLSTLAGISIAMMFVKKKKA